MLKFSGFANLTSCLDMFGTVMPSQEQLKAANKQKQQKCNKMHDTLAVVAEL